MIKRKLLIFIQFTFLFTSNCLAEQGVSSTTIKLGMSNALTGPASQLGKELHKGSKIYFDKINRNGGISGRKIDLISLDDGYEPLKTIANTHQLIAQEVFALFGYVGTPTSHAILSILKQKNTLFLMPFTGADFLRTPEHNNIFNLRASYQQEAKLQLDFLIKEKGFKKIALVIQADQFGLAAEKFFLHYMKEFNLTPAVTSRYRRNSDDISQVLSTIKPTGLDAVIFVGTYQPLAKLINLGFEQGFTPFYTTLSFISSADLYSRLKYKSRVMVSEVMPEPTRCSWKICYQFRADMKKAGITQPNRVQLEGYLNAYIFSEVAKKCQAMLTKTCFIKQFEQLSLRDKTIPLQYSNQNHQGLQKLYRSFSIGASKEKS